MSQIAKKDTERGIRSASSLASLIVEFALYREQGMIPGPRVRV